MTCARQSSSQFGTKCAVVPPARDRATVDFLRAMVLASPRTIERSHAIFLDRQNAYLGDTPLGEGRIGSLSIRMREVFGKALAIGAHAIVLAHNHPSGQCRPSQYDIDATGRLKAVANALDIELLDHLIITQDAVYSMRAGGKL